MKTEKEILNNNQKEILHKGITEIMQRANKIGDSIFNKENLEISLGEFLILESKVRELNNFLKDIVEVVEDKNAENIKEDEKSLIDKKE